MSIVHVKCPRRIACSLNKKKINITDPSAKPGSNYFCLFSSSDIVFLISFPNPNGFVHSGSR